MIYDHDWENTIRYLIYHKLPSFITPNAMIFRETFISMLRYELRICASAHSLKLTDTVENHITAFLESLTQ